MISGGDRRGGRLGPGSESGVEGGLALLGVVIVLVFGIFFARLFQLQIIEGADLRRRSERNSVRTLRLEAPRGDILDREGRALASTRPAFGVQIIPNDLHRPEPTFGALAMLLDEDPALLSERVGKPQGRKRFQPVRLAGDLEYDRWRAIESHGFAMPGVLTDVQPRRSYLQGELAAHLLGSIGEIRRDQLETRRYADYRPGEVIGQSGIETRLEEDLRGRAGGRNVVVDVAGRMGEELEKVDALPGSNVVLTIDLDLQQAAEEALMPEVIGGQPKLGAVVALDPRSGDVLVLVSKPSYDPNHFAGGIDSATWKQLTSDEWRPIQNRALSGQYPPGSTYKAIVAAAGLQEGLVEPEEIVFCPGHFKLGRRTYRCWKRGGHGPVDLQRAIVESCDVYFYQLGLKLGIDRLAFFARGFNFGRSTGIGLAHEQPGLVPTSAWKERRFKEPWVRGETVSAAIGQGFNLATPLQLAVAYAAIANGGQLVTPRILLRVEGRDGSVRQGPPVEFRGKVPVDPQYLEIVGRGLEGVVSGIGGTGARARVKGVRVAGKTGTAQVVRLEHTEGMEDDEVPMRYRDHAWFAAYAPVGAPEIVVAVVVEHGGHGGSAAGPVAQRVLNRYFEKQRGEAPPVPEAPPPAPLAPPSETPAPIRVTAAPVAAATGGGPALEVDRAGD